MTASLTDSHLRCIERIRRALLNIERLRVSINDAEQANGLPMRRLLLPELGMLYYDTDELLLAGSLDAYQAECVRLVSAQYQKTKGQQ